MNNPEHFSSGLTSTIHGLLFVASDVEAADDSDFNLWYDKEHVEERARIPGFLSAARYVSQNRGPKYLGLYRTESLDVFRSASYRSAFERQTPWSLVNLDRMLQPMRRVCAVRAVVGFGTGSHIAILPLPQPNNAIETEMLVRRAAGAGQLQAEHVGFVQSYLLVPEATLSTPLPRESTDGRVLQPMLVVEASNAEAAQSSCDACAAALGVGTDNVWLLRLGWKLNSADLG